MDQKQGGWIQDLIEALKKRAENYYAAGKSKWQSLFEEPRTIPKAPPKREEGPTISFGG